MISIWERNEFTHYDILIIGSGIVGLTTAYYLHQQKPSLKMAVVERGIFPSGASTKNAGFACMGSASELLDNLSTSTEEEVLELFLLRKHGLERLQHIIGKTQMGYQQQGSYELLHEQELSTLNQLDYLNRLLEKNLGLNAFESCPEKISDFGFNPSQVKGLIANVCEGEIDTGLLMKNLLTLVQGKGISVLNGCNVVNLEETEKGVNLFCTNPVSDTPVNLFANNLIICNNAFASGLFPELDVVPGRGQVLITKPIQNLPFKGIFHFDKGYYYFREYKNCVLFGGGRNLDVEKETSTQFDLNPTIQQTLENKLREIILPDQDFEIDMRWTGIMGFGKQKRPIVKQYSRHIFIGVRMGGMGVAIGSEIGYQLSELVLA